MVEVKESMNFATLEDVSKTALEFLLRQGCVNFIVKTWRENRLIRKGCFGLVGWVERFFKFVKKFFAKDFGRYIQIG